MVDFFLISNKRLNIYKNDDIIQAKEKGGIWNEKGIDDMFYAYIKCNTCWMFQQS